MAENAANFTTTFQNRPSIFEVIAQKCLNETLHPGLQRIALFLSTNFPEKFNFLNEHYDEVFLCVNALLQFYYMKFYDSSFSENFYGLKRVLTNGNPLTNHEKELSLIFLIAVPYFKKKIDDKLQLYKIQNAEGCLRKDLEGTAKRTLIFSYSAFEVVWGLVSLHNHLQYMAGKTEHQLLILNLLGIKLTYSNEEAQKSFWSMVFENKLSFSELSFGLIRNAVSTIFETSAFFLQFIHAWNAQKPNYNINDLPKVNAPSSDNKSKSFQGICPVCLQRWCIPTVLPVSGYIFCFKCILKRLNESPKCPVTNLPARPLDIVRLYTND